MGNLKACQKYTQWSNNINTSSLKLYNWNLFNFKNIDLHIFLQQA